MLMHWLACFKGIWIGIKLFLIQGKAYVRQVIQYYRTLSKYNLSCLYSPGLKITKGKIWLSVADKMLKCAKIWSKPKLCLIVLKQLLELSVKHLEKLKLN